MKRDARQQAADLISQVYAALLGNDTWQSFLDNLSSALPNGKTTLFYHDLANRSGAFSLHSRFESKFIADYRDYYSARNPWMARAASRPLDLGVRAEFMLPRDRLVRTEFYADFLKPQGLASGVGVTIMRDRGCNFMLSTVFGEADDAVADAAAEVMGALAPHLRQAFAYYKKASASSIVGAASDALGVAIVVFGAGRRLHWANAAGQEVLALGDPIGIDTCGRIGARRGDVREALEAALELAIRGGNLAKKTMVLPSGDGWSAPQKLTLVVPTLTPFEKYFAGPCVVVLVEQPAGTQMPDEDRLRAAYALTPGEARLARILATGATLADAAAAQGITRETARSQLKRVFAKMDVHRQAELVARIHRLEVESA
jgi:DNA-binding CsgD family transcriptional regulator